MSVFDTMAWAKAQRTGSVGCKAVLMALAERTGDHPVCFPSQKLIARETEQGERTVRRHLAHLEEVGLIRSSRTYIGSDGEPLPRGRASNRYELLVSRCPDQPADLAGGREATNRPDGADQAATGGRWSDDQPANPNRPTGHLRPTNRPPETDQPATCGLLSTKEPPYLEEPSLELSLDDARSGPGTEAPPAAIDRFDEFWQRYPRCVGQGAARKAWAKATKTVSADEILEGVDRYATERRGQDQKFTAHPATWLNQERWTDAPGANRTAAAPPRTRQVDTDRTGKSRVMTPEEAWA